MEQYVIAGDLGTSSVKIVAVSTSRKLLSSTNENYQLYTEGLCAEQDPQQFWDAICRGTRTLLAGGLDPKNCVGVVFGTQWRGLIPIDHEGNILRRAIIWMDKRAAKEAEELNHALGREIFCGMDYWPKLMWFRKHEPELYQQADYILEANAFLKWKATGRICSDNTNCYTRSYHSGRNEFYNEILKAADLDPEKFPPLCEPSQQIGSLTAQAAQELQLLEGTPVFGGCCDIPAMAIGSGCSQPGDLHAYLGTSGWLGYVQSVDPMEAYCPSLNRQYDVGFYAMGISVGPSTDWMLRNFFALEKEKLGNNIWNYMDEAMDAIPAGSNRLLVAPWFFGGRPPLSSNLARGTFLNLNSSHTPMHMMKALFEGYCYIMRQNLERIAKRAEATDIKAVTVCGGGSMNRHWMQAMADILHLEIRVPEDTTSIGSIGVAYCALVGLGVVENFDSIGKNMKFARVYTPNSNHFAEYELLYQQFTKLYDQLAHTFEALNS